MLRITIGFAMAVTLAGCASTSGRVDQAAAADAIRFGVEACERHFLEGMTMEEAIAASAHGRPFVRAERNFEQWPHGPKPWRLAGMDIWVGPLSDADDEDECRVLALDVGSISLRDAIMKEHIARAERAWKAWETRGSGHRAVCTTDNVPDGKSLLVGATYEVASDSRTPEIVGAPFPSKFRVMVVNEKTCPEDFYGYS